jgi:hypothetical protein
MGTPMSPQALSVKIASERIGESVRLNFGTEEPIRILGLPARGVCDCSTFDVYITGKQVVRKGLVQGVEAWFTVHSEFDVLYLNALEQSDVKRAWREETRNSHAYGGFRFTVDLASESRFHRPDSHVQYNIDTFQEAMIKRLYKDGDAAWRRRAAHGYPRVPSAPVDLVGLIYVLLHQHREEAVKEGWPADVRRTLNDLPTFHLDVDERSRCATWYAHSHAPPKPAPAIVHRARPENFRMPDEVAAAGWSATISADERCEDPHLTVTRNGERIRVNLRTQEVMDGRDSDLPDPVLEAVLECWDDWCALWDERYPINPVKGTHEDGQPPK